MGIKALNEDRGFQVGVATEVDDLADGVNARVGAPAGVHARSLAGEFGKSLFERRLHGPQTRLSLPAMEVGAVVADEDLEVAHRRLDPMLAVPRKGRECFRGLVFTDSCSRSRSD